jgi:plasmid stabilization system protein ParE
LGNASFVNTAKMSPVERLADFRRDYENQFEWYLAKAGEKIALNFEEAVEKTFIRLAKKPTLGRLRHFRHPKLTGIRSFAVCAPFDQILVF